jgi:PAS domain S-box-containing protein
MARGDDAARRILVIDDDRDVAEAATITLESWGCTVAMASDADQALATLDGFDAGVALIDVRLDGADGLALIATLQAKTPGLLCIVSSAYADLDMTIGALRAGAEDFLRKPLDEAELYAALERCFAKRALRRDKADAEAAEKQARDELEIRVETRTAELLETNSQLLQENADRARVEDELRDSEVHYRSLFDETPVGVWEEDWSAIKVMLDGLARRGVKDLRGYFQRRPEQLRKAYDLGVATEVNQAACTIYGAPDKQTIIDMTASALVLAGELDGFRDTLLSFVDGGFDVAYEAEDQRYDGSFIFIRSHIVVPALNRHDWARVIFTVEDINARREVARALEESRAQLQSILDNSPAMISLKDAEGRYLLANRVFEQIFGTTGERIEGKLSKDVLPAENVESARAQDLHILRNLKPHSVEETIHVGGEERTVLTTKFPVLDDSGEALAIGSIASDITERKQAEDALRESEAFLRSVVDSAPAAINIRDKDDRFILVNKLLADYYGTTPENMIGRFSDKFGRPERGATDDPEDISEVLATGETTLMHEATYSDGTTWLTSRAPVKGDDGTVAYVVTTAFDISDRKRAEEALKESEVRYREVFDDAPTALWVEDWSPIKQMVDRLTEEGVEDFAAYFADHRDLVAEAYDSTDTLQISDACRELYGATSIQQLIDSHSGALVLPEELDAFTEMLLGLIEGRWHQETESLDAKMDGTEIMFRTRFVVPPAHRHDWSRLIYSLEDIDDRKRAEEALKESEVRYREVFDDAPSALWVQDWSRIKQMIDRLTDEGVEDFGAYFADHRDFVAETYDLIDVLQISEANLELFGATSIEQLVDASRGMHVLPEEVDAFAEILLGLTEGRWSQETESLDDKMDGTEIMIRTRSVVPPAHRHDWSRLIYSLEDVTERKRAEEALKESEARYREVFDDAPSALWVEDWSRVKQMVDRLTEEGVEDFAAYFADHRDLVAEAYDLAEVLQVSEANLELYGTTSIQQLVDSHNAAIVSPEELDAHVEILLRLIEGRWSLEKELPYAKFDGTKIMFRTRSVVPPAHRHDWSRLIYSLEDVTERKQAEEALKESEARLRQAQGIAQIGNYLWDEVKDESLYYSDLVNEIFGISSDDAPDTIGKVIDRVHPDDRDRLSEAYETSIVAGGAYDLEYRIVRPDGEVRHVHEISNPEYDDAGTLIRSVGVVQDITGIRTAEERFRTLLESTPDAMIVANENGEIVLINDQVEVLFGYDRGELVGMPVETLMPQSVRQQHHGYREFYAADPRVRPMGKSAELHGVNRDGSEFPVEISLSPIHDDDGMLIVAAVRDITERRRAEEIIRTRDAWLGGILENAPIQVVLKDTDGRIMAISQNVADFFGLTRDDFIGRTTVDFLPEEIANTYMAADREVIEKGELVQKEVTEELDGAKLHFLNAKFPLRDSDGEIIGVCSLTSDITEIKTVQEQLFQAQKMEAVGQLTGGIAHDFNNLLAVVMGNLELVEDEMEGNDELRELLSLAIGATDDAAVLTQRLLAFSRKQPLSPRAADANDLVDKIVALMRRTLDKSIDLRTALTGNLAPLFVDPSQLENALVNLLVNARDAMPRGGRVTIETGVVYLDKTSAAFEAEMAPGDYVTVAVSDNGEGMAPETIEHAVEPFFTTKKIGEGSGLGLSMVFGFVKQSGGHITIESELGRGTTVTLFLPVAIEMTVDDAPPSDRVEDRRGAGEAILVVENNEQLRQLAVLNLISLGYSVHQAGDGMAALEVLDQTPDIVLLFTDIVLPGAMDGVQLAMEARARRSDLRVLYTSAYPQNALVKQGRIDGEFDLVEKPYRKSDLAVRMAAALASPGTIEMPKESA